MKTYLQPLLIVSTKCYYRENGKRLSKGKSKTMKNDKVLCGH